MEIENSQVEEILRLAGWHGIKSLFLYECGMMLSIIVSSGCPNNVPHFGWLDIIEIHTLTVLKAISPKSGCQWSHAPSESLGRIPSCLPGHQCLVIFACSCITPASASVVTVFSLYISVSSHGCLPSDFSLSSFYNDIIILDWGPCLLQCHLILTTTSSMTLFPNKVPFWDTRD